MMYISATAAVCSGLYSFGMTLVIWSFYIYVNTGCLACCLGCWRPWWGVVFRGGRRVRRFVLCRGCMMFLLVLSPPPCFEAECCLFCGRRRVAVARYQMICLVLVNIRHS